MTMFETAHKKRALSMPFNVQEFSPLSFDEEAALIDRAKHDDLARSEMQNRYLKMLFHVAQAYMRPSEHGPISKFDSLPEIDDIVGESFASLDKAITDYDRAKGVKFITFSERYVRQHLDNILRDERVLKERTPHVKVEKTEEEITKEKEEIEKDKLEHPEKKDRKVDPKKTIFFGRPESLDIEISSPGGSSEDTRRFIDTIKDIKQDFISKLEWESFIDVVLGRLKDEKAKQIWLEIANRYGEPSLKTQLSKKYNISPSQITFIIKNKISPIVQQVKQEEEAI